MNLKETIEDVLQTVADDFSFLGVGVGQRVKKQIVVRLVRSLQTKYKTLYEVDNLRQRVEQYEQQGTAQSLRMEMEERDRLIKLLLRDKVDEKTFTFDAADLQGTDEWTLVLDPGEDGKNMGAHITQETDDIWLEQ
mgnify:CR=1 FL=1